MRCTGSAPSSWKPSLDVFSPSPRQARRLSIAGQCEFLLFITRTWDLNSLSLLRVADFHRLMWSCLIDFPESSGHAKTHANASNNAYQTAHSQAVKDLCPMDPVLLTVSYSFATFARDVLNCQNRSCTIMQRAIDDAAAYAAAHPHEKFSPESRKEIQKLRKKLESWRNTSTSP